MSLQGGLRRDAQDADGRMGSITITVLLLLTFAMKEDGRRCKESNLTNVTNMSITYITPDVRYSGFYSNGTTAASKFPPSRLLQILEAHYLAEPHAIAFALN